MNSSDRKGSQGIGNRSRDGILKVDDADLPPDSLNRDNVNTPMVNLLLLRVILRAGDHVRLLPGAHTDLGRAEGTGCPGLDLHEDRLAIPESEQVDLTIWCAHITVKNLKTPRPQIV